MRISAPDMTVVKILKTWGWGRVGEDLILLGQGANNLPSTLKEGFLEGAFLVDLEVFIFNLAEIWKYVSRIVFLRMRHIVFLQIAVLTNHQ